jgi:hypothetical protein
MDGNKITEIEQNPKRATQHLETCFCPYTNYFRKPIIILKPSTTFLFGHISIHKQKHIYGDLIYISVHLHLLMNYVTKSN